MSDKTVQEEIAGLAAAVRELRDREVAVELARLRAEVEALRDGAGRCCGWHHPVMPVYPITWTAPAVHYYPPTITCGSIAASEISGATVTSDTWTSTLTTAN